jgi:hypothetical protein
VLSSLISQIFIRSREVKAKVKEDRRRIKEKGIGVRRIEK